jgi:protein-histidine N-methyltransferase
VLHLSTLPNLFLTALSALSLLLPESQGAALDIEPSPSLISALRSELRKRNVSVDLVSGAWGKDFVDTIRRIENVQVSSNSGMGKPLVLILASETIYAPASLHSFAETLVQLIRMAKSQGAEARAFVAAKRVYFGVGGGVLEFERVLVEYGGKIVEVWSSEGGVGRCTIEVMLD